MAKGLTRLSEQVEEFHKQIKEIEDEKEKQFYAQAYSRRENSNFFVITRTFSRYQDTGDKQRILYDFGENSLILKILPSSL